MVNLTSPLVPLSIGALILLICYGLQSNPHTAWEPVSITQFMPANLRSSVLAEAKAFDKASAPAPARQQYSCKVSEDCGGGNCTAGLCLCPPGAGGAGCALNASTIFRAHDVWAGLEQKLRDKDLGAAADPDVYAEFMAMVPAPGPQLVVDVGAWKGLSSSHLAGQLKRRGHGVLVCVDTWLGSLESWAKPTTNGKDPQRDLALANGYPDIYTTFLSNMWHAGLKDFVVPFPVPSRLATQLFTHVGARPDFVHIDASHEYEDVLEDISSWWGLLAPGGVLMGDDYTHAWPGVMKAVNEFVVQHRLHLNRTGDEASRCQWAVQKPLKY